MPASPSKNPEPQGCPFLSASHVTFSNVSKPIAPVWYMFAPNAAVHDHDSSLMKIKRGIRRAARMKAGRCPLAF